MNMFVLKIVWLWLVAVVLHLGLAPAAVLAGQPLKVAASFSILGDMARNVGGGKAAVTVLVGPNADAHMFQPTPADARVVAGADLVVVNGLGFEGWLDRLVRASGRKGPVIVASRGVRALAMADEHEHEGGGRTTDPHAWHSPANAKIYVANIEKALAAADPENAEFYAANAKEYQNKIDAMDAWARTEFARIPPARRKVVTSHEAFGYLGRTYGITLLAPEGFSTESEASARNVGKLIRQIKKEGIKALFIENMTDPRLVENIAAETGVKPGGALYSDALSAADGPAATYLDMFRYNVERMVEAMTRN